MRNHLFFLPLIALWTLIAAPVIAQNTPAQIRVANFSPDVGNLEVYLDGLPSGIQTLQYNDISGWVQIPAGRRQISFVPVGASVEQAVVGPFAVNLPSGSWSTIPVLGLRQNRNLYAVLITEDYPTAIAPGSVRITFFNGIPGTAPLNLFDAGGAVLAEGVGFGRSANVDLPAGTHSMRIAPAGSSGGLGTGDIQLEAGTYYLLGAIRRESGGGLVLRAITQQSVSGLLAMQAEGATSEPPTPDFAATTPTAPHGSPTPFATNTPRFAQSQTPAPLATDTEPATATLALNPTPVPTLGTNATATPVDLAQALTPTPSVGEARDIVDVIASIPELSILLRGIQGVGLEDDLREGGPHTIFAPLDSGWESLIQVFPDILPDSQAIRNLIEYHIVADRVPTMFMFNQMTLMTVQGASIRIAIVEGQIRLDNVALALETDIEAPNGILHIIDVPLVPPDMRPPGFPSSGAPQG